MNKNSNNQRNAVFSSTLPVLIVLLVIILAFAGKINAGKNPGGAQSDSLHELQASSEETGGSPQESEGGQYERYYRTLISDPVDGKEKLVELRYKKDGTLTEVIIDDKSLTRAERRKNEKIINKAMTEERNVGKEVDELIDGIGHAMEETMGVISDLFVPGDDDNNDPEVSDSDSSRNDSRPVTRKKDRKARLTTLEELESGEEK